jgi:hypothetical protein
MTAAERKQIAQRIKDLQPDITNRQIARTLGVHHDTIDRDIGGNPPPDDGSSSDRGRHNGGNPPDTITGKQAATVINRREQNAQPREHAVREIEFPAGRYPILLADLPWRYERWDDLDKAIDFLIECQQVILRWWDDHVQPAGQGRIVADHTTIFTAAEAGEKIGTDKTRVSR